MRCDLQLQSHTRANIYRCACFKIAELKTGGSNPISANTRRGQSVGIQELLVIKGLEALKPNRF